MSFSSMLLASSRSRLKSPKAKTSDSSLHHIHHGDSSIPSSPQPIHAATTGKATPPPSKPSPPTPPPHPPLLLRPKPRRPNIRPPQLNPKYLLHGPQNLLIRRRTPALEISNDARGGVALCREVFLGHLRLHLLALVGDHGADFFADCVGLDDLVAAVDFGEALAFAAAGLRLLACSSHGLRLW
jgi:hypothetical protein